MRQCAVTAAPMVDEEPAATVPFTASFAAVAVAPAACGHVHGGHVADSR